MKPLLLLSLLASISHGEIITLAHPSEALPKKDTVVWSPLFQARSFGEIDPFSESRRFIYDRPFFVFLRRDGAEWPYFGAWIGDVTALTRISEEQF